MGVLGAVCTTWLLVVQVGGLQHTLAPQMLLLGRTPLPTSDGSSTSQDMPEEGEGSGWGQITLLKQGAQQVLLRQGDAIIWNDCALFPLGYP